MISDLLGLHDPFLIAEVGLAHDGSLGLAHAFIGVAARCGADAVKFQTHIAEAESSDREPFRVKFSPQDLSRFEYWHRTSFTEEQWAGLKRHAEDLNLVFLSSAFSMAAVELLDRIGIQAWKVPSGEVGSVSMIERMAATGRPLLVSTGMSDWGEVSGIVADMNRLAPGRYLIMQCTTAYPTPPESVGLNVLTGIKERFECPVGLSDHSGTIFPALAAATLGAEAIEVHLTLSRDMFGPDVSSSLLPDDLSRLAEGLSWHRSMRGNPLDKDRMAKELAPLKKTFGKSAVASRDLAPGEAIEAEDVEFRKPGHGIDERTFASFLGRRLTHPVEKGRPLSTEDFVQ